MQRIRTILQLLLRDEHSSMRGRMAMLASLLILGTVATGLLLMPLGAQTLLAHLRTGAGAGGDA